LPISTINRQIGTDLLKMGWSCSPKGLSFSVNSLTFFLKKCLSFNASVRLLDKFGSKEDWDNDCLKMKVDDVLSKYCPSSFVED